MAKRLWVTRCLAGVLFIVPYTDSFETNQFKGFTVRLSISNITNNNVDILPLDTTPYPYDGTFDINISTPTEARFCRLILPKPASVDFTTYPVVLCEVETFPLFQGSECPFEKYGDQCNSHCSGHCLNNKTCHHISGHCTNGCRAGYNTSDVFCNTECENGYYGLMCSNTCGHCLSEQPCDKVTGHCFNGCDRGYNGPLCIQICTNGLFDYNCESRCHCKTADDTCDIFYGNCLNGCEFGRVGSNCSEECEDGLFGENCKMTCGFCKNGTVCDKVSGNCTSDCDRGYRGHQCKSGCEKQTFGYNCMNACHCYECNDVDGSCGIYSCYRDWKGESCSEPIHTNEKQAESPKTGDENTAFAVVSTLLVVSVIGHIVVVTIYCRRKARKSYAKEEKTNQNDYTVPGPSMASDYATLDVAEMQHIPTDRRY